MIRVTILCKVFRYLNIFSFSDNCCMVVFGWNFCDMEAYPKNTL